MIESLSLEEEKMIKDITNIFRLKNYITLKLKIKEIFSDHKKKLNNSKSIKDRILRDIKNLFEHEEDSNY